jgi:hypothetical protein
MTDCPSTARSATSPRAALSLRRATECLARPQCFTLRAANKAAQLAARAGWNERRRHAAAEAITLHTSLWRRETAPRHTPCSWAPRSTSSATAIGTSTRPLSTRPCRTTHRLDLKRQSAPIFEAQAVANPRSRLDVITRYLAANWFMRHEPFGEQIITSASGPVARGRRRGRSPRSSRPARAPAAREPTRGRCGWRARRSARPRRARRPGPRPA